VTACAGDTKLHDYQVVNGRRRMGVMWMSIHAEIYVYFYPKIFKGRFNHQFKSVCSFNTPGDMATLQAA